VCHRYSCMFLNKKGGWGGVWTGKKQKSARPERGAFSSSCGRSAQVVNQDFTFSTLCELKATVNLLKTLLPLKTGCLGRCLLQLLYGRTTETTGKVVNEGFGVDGGFRAFKGLWEACGCVQVMSFTTGYISRFVAISGSGS